MIPSPPLTVSFLESTSRAKKGGFAWSSASQRWSRRNSPGRGVASSGPAAPPPTRAPGAVDSGPRPRCGRLRSPNADCGAGGPELGRRGVQFPGGRDAGRVSTSLQLAQDPSVTGEIPVDTVHILLGGPVLAPEP